MPPPSDPTPGDSQQPQQPVYAPPVYPPAPEAAAAAGQHPPVPPQGSGQQPAQGYGPPPQGYGQLPPVPPVPPQGYGQQPYQAGGYQPQQKPPMNVLAIVGFIGAFFISIAGIVLGHIALSQIKRTGEGGRGLALAATIIGYARIALDILGTIAFLGFMGIVGNAAWQYDGPASSGSDSEYFDEFDHGFGEDGTDGWELDPSDLPWTGTDNEVFCTSLLMPEAPVEMDSPEYFEQLLGFTDNAELRGILEQQRDLAASEPGSSAEESLDRLDAGAEWANARMQLSFACMGESVTP